MDLPNDMIDIITSFSLLMDIINLEKTCQLFNDICKKNTHQLLETDLYCKYMEYYNRQQPPQFELKDIKKLNLIMKDSNNLLNKMIPIIKWHTHLIHFNLKISMRFDITAINKILNDSFASKYSN